MAGLLPGPHAVPAFLQPHLEQPLLSQVHIIITDDTTSSYLLQSLSPTIPR